MANDVLTKDNIRLNQSLNSKEEAVRYTGGILADNGYVQDAYIDKMLERENVTSTFMGNYVAIPHGTEDARDLVQETGLSVVTVPDGVDFDGNTVKVLIGIAGKEDEHLEILSKIAIVCAEEENIQTIVEATSEEDIINLFDEVN
ncbi:mannitol-specific phosphotransferase enzyme IIA component [Lentibacillus kapialis]|uniref:Mannitol-specific phosphotransferase enzyme IIA component n=1 Tax=Lentibacillus kapialis TaxID=340214 RepID=A0A917PVN4_9BACI|nr:PTS sugar transporter subunit IIA [Lentibacillus kapialis]GGJ94798.1 mannitol-specific phosphotransferase enzyme IIA component [Lentibacillus kapialis]